jgi:DNA-binding PadR family transcriptional regulator
MAKRRASLTELEGCVLGTIAVRGPCTPYAIRREFQKSPSQHWSASAGAVYPLVLRLRHRGLLRIAQQSRDGRNGRLYALTAVGRRALREWIRPPFSSFTISVPPDPLRTRLGFFSVLTPGERRMFVTQARTQTKAHLLEVKRYTKRMESGGEVFEHLVSRGAQRMVEARLMWLAELRRAIPRTSDDPCRGS